MRLETWVWEHAHAQLVAELAGQGLTADQFRERLARLMAPANPLRGFVEEYPWLGPPPGDILADAIRAMKTRLATTNESNRAVEEKVTG